MPNPPAYPPQPSPPDEKEQGWYKPGYRAMKCTTCPKIYMGHPDSKQCKLCASLSQLKAIYEKK